MRIKAGWRTEVHLDTDEADACGVRDGETSTLVNYPALEQGLLHRVTKQALLIDRIVARVLALLNA